MSRAINPKLRIRQLLSMTENGLRASKAFVPTGTHTRRMTRRGIGAARTLRHLLLS